MLWTEKYCPKNASEFVIHKEIVEKFNELSAATDLPHLIFSGAPGSGKTTLVRQLLRTIFGPESDKVQMTSSTRNMKVSETRQINVDVHTLRSDVYVEMNPSDYGRNDVHVVQNEMKSLSDGCLGQNFTALVLNEVEHMSKASQHALRRTMEKTSTRCRIIMCCSNLSHVIDPIKSRCSVIRVPCPTNEDLHNIFMKIADTEQFRIDPAVGDQVIQSCGRNLRSCVLCLQACHGKGLFIGLDQKVSIPEWKMSIKEISNDLLRQQNPKMILQIRTKLYELLASCIPPTVILMTLFEELMSRVDSPIQHPLVEFAAHYDREIRNGGKAIFHLEAFIVNIMSSYLDLK